MAALPALVSIHGRRFGLIPGGLRVDGMDIFPNFVRGKDWFVNAKLGANTNDGETYDTATATFAELVDGDRRLRSGDRIWITGKIREQTSTPAGIFDVTVIGLGSPRHADDHTEPSGGGYMGGSSAASWLAPASPTAATPLLTVRQQGWKFINILWDGPSDAAALQLFRDAGSGDAEDDASHAHIIGCKFVAGQNHIEFKGGLSQCILEDNLFFGATAYSILETVGAGVGTNNYHRFLRNHWHNNDGHIDMGMNYASIFANIFGKWTTKAVDLATGSNNMLNGNYLFGDYDAGYVAGTSDEWAGNFSMDLTSDEVGDNGITTAVPVA